MYTDALQLQIELPRYKRIGSIVLGDNNTRIRVLSTILVYNLYTSIVKKKILSFVRRDNYIYVHFCAKI